MLSRGILRASRFMTTRGYATEAKSSGKLKLNFVLPHQSLLKNTEVHQVNLSSSEGDMGILADHVPSIAELKPGVVEILSNTDKPKRYFVSGGFAVIHPDSTLNINAVDAFALEDIDYEAARKAADEATRALSTASASEADKADAQIRLDVFKAIEAAAKLK